MRQIPVISGHPLRRLCSGGRELAPRDAREPDEALAVSSGSRSEPGRMAATASKASAAMARRIMRMFIRGCPQLAFNLAATDRDRFHPIAAWSTEKHPQSCTGKVAAQGKRTGTFEASALAGCQGQRPQSRPYFRTPLSGTRSLLLRDNDTDAGQRPL
jgi:hypothetical protein